jgi:hypothetical protein
LKKYKKIKQTGDVKMKKLLVVLGILFLAAFSAQAEEQEEIFPLSGMPAQATRFGGNIDWEMYDGIWSHDGNFWQPRLPEINKSASLIEDIPLVEGVYNFEHSVCEVWSSSEGVEYTDSVITATFTPSYVSISCEGGEASGFALRVQEFVEVVPEKGEVFTALFEVQIFESPQGEAYQAQMESDGRIWQPNLPSGDERMAHAVELSLPEGTFYLNSSMCYATGFFSKYLVLEAASEVHIQCQGGPSSGFELVPRDVPAPFQVALPLVIR